VVAAAARRMIFDNMLAEKKSAGDRDDRRSVVEVDSRE